MGKHKTSQESVPAKHGRVKKITSPTLQPCRGPRRFTFGKLWNIHRLRGLQARVHGPRSECQLPFARIPDDRGLYVLLRVLLWQVSWHSRGALAQNLGEKQGSDPTAPGMGPSWLNQLPSVYRQQVVDAQVLRHVSAVFEILGKLQGSHLHLRGPYT